VYLAILWSFQELKMSVLYRPERLLKEETQIQRENEKCDLNEEIEREREREKEKGVTKRSSEGVIRIQVGEDKRMRRLRTARRLMIVQVDYDRVLLFSNANQTLNKDREN
jgi:hypothetical protein